MDDVPVIYGLEDFQARVLAPQLAETEKINFLVGTQSLKNNNQVQLIEYDDDTEVLTKSHFEHPDGEVCGLSSAPQTPDIVATVHYKTQDYHTECGASIWRMPLGSHSGSAKGSSGLPLERVCDLTDVPKEEVQFKVHGIVWAPEDDTRLASTVDNRIVIWDLNVAGSQAKASNHLSVEGKASQHFGQVRWCPHQKASHVASTMGTSVISFDLRSMEKAWTIENTHLSSVRDLDFNPNKQYFVATCGDDGAVKIWDVRNPTSPVLTRSDHSHWVWSVRFNSSYDQLLLSCSSDQRVILNNLPSVASQPIEFSADEDLTKERLREEDGVLRIYEDHEESVYSVEWSAGDTWTFASISFDGRLVMNKVPKDFKYKQFM